MKKLISLMLISILIISMTTVGFAAFATGKYKVSESHADIYFSANTTSRKLGEIPKNTYIEITEIRNDTFGKTYLASEDISGWVLLDKLTFVGNNETDTDIKEIKIKSLPDKLTYVDGVEKLDLTGLTVVSVNKSNRETPVYAYSVFTPEMKGVGEKTVKITYSPDGKNTFTTEFTVTVIREDAVKISVVTPPKAQYLENQLLDLSALKIKTEFTDTSKNVTLTYDEMIKNSDYTVSGCHGEKHGSVLSEGKHEISISYKYSDISCSFTINVTPRTLISLTIKQQPYNLTVYSNKEIPVLDGLILKAEYDNGEIEDVYHYSCEAVCEPEKFAIGPGNRVEVRFGGKSVTLEFRYSLAAPVKIMLEFKDKEGNTIPITYLKGEIIDLGGIRVRLVYSDDTFEYINDYKISAPDYNIMGSQNISVEYMEFSEVFTIHISPYYSKGDVNGDGRVTASDARTILRASVGLTTLGGQLLFAGDTTRDGKISAADARLALRASVGLENLYITL